MPDAVEPEVVADPFHVEMELPASPSTTPGEPAAETPAPDTIPAPAPHPDTLSAAHGFPRDRRCPQE